MNIQSSNHHPTQVAIYALSFGTYVLNAYLQLPGAKADVLVMDGPVPPQRWALERNPEWMSRVAEVAQIATTPHSRLPPSGSSKWPLLQ